MFFATSARLKVYTQQEQGFLQHGPHKRFGWAACSVTIVGFFKAGVRQHGAAVSTGATLD
jgi:hypothetical protein